jgi:hypothetical protein
MIRWGGAFVAVALLALAVQTLHELRTWQNASGAYIGIGGGCVGVGKGPPQEALRPLEYILLWPEASFHAGNWWVLVPLWMIAALVLGAAAVATRATVGDRGTRCGRCPKCKYDRAGIAEDAKCPECGAAPTIG